MNRIWAWHFGEGLQRVTSDFGLLGGVPSNQKLLDYLASEFVAHNYSMKWLHKLIVTSDTYRLASKAEPEVVSANIQSDARDTYLWHFRLQRLEAEPIWDTILSVSNDLDSRSAANRSRSSSPTPRDDEHTNRRGIYIRARLHSEHRRDGQLPAVLRRGRRPHALPHSHADRYRPAGACSRMNDDMIEKETEKFADSVMDEATGDVKTAVDLAYRRRWGARLPARNWTRR